MSENKDLTKEQLVTLNSLINGILAEKGYKNNRPVRIWVIGTLAGKGIDSSSDLNQADWEKIKNEAYSKFEEDEYEVKEKFKNKVGKLIEAWEED